MKFKLIPIKTIEEKVVGDGTVYDLSVKDDHSYTANGIKTSNSCCSTRGSVSFGVPTLTSVMSCEERRENAYLIADGGIEHNADIIKAIRCGADLVMIGKKFAQTNLSSGTKLDANKEFTENEEEIAYCQYRGMSSFDARQASPCRKNASVEGVTGYVKYFGTTENFINTLNENLKTAIAYYGGCVNWSQFRKMVKVIRISQAGMNESATRLIHF